MLSFLKHLHKKVSNFYPLIHLFQNYLNNTNDILGIYIFFWENVQTLLSKYITAYDETGKENQVIFNFLQAKDPELEISKLKYLLLIFLITPFRFPAVTLNRPL